MIERQRAAPPSDSAHEKTTAARHEGEPHMAAGDKQATTQPAKASKGFTNEERAAIRERAKEQKAASKAEGAQDLLAKIAEMAPPDRAMAERVHTIVLANAPNLSPTTWYGMPAYATSAGKIICFFQPAKKFKTRYATLGFNDGANLDDGGLWPVAYALKDLTAAEEAQISALVRRAVR
jgi:uncharacterized protein YdhG (YjbR/CyaY superfamily)